MKNKVFWFTILTLSLLWVAAVGLSQVDADTPTAPPSLSLGAGQVSAIYYGDDPEGIQTSLDAGPKAPCPGWNLYYSLSLTNTQAITPLTQLVISDVLPAGTWFNGEAQGSLPITYDPASRTVSWVAASLAPGERINLQLTLRSYSYLQPGTIITNTFTYSATELTQPGSISGVSIVARCSTATPTPTNTYAPTATPRPTNTATPTTTPTRQVFRANLPLVFREHQ
jgi:uncharacterized repeat protein (TIGR01451 family)